MPGRSLHRLRWLTVLALAAACVAGAGCSEIAELRSTYQPASLQEARRVPGADPARGRQLVAQYGCVNCHQIPGHREPTAHVGPPLTRFALRTNIGGSLPNQPGELVRFVMNAPEALPGTGMPAIPLSVDEAHHVAAYLYTLK